MSRKISVVTTFHPQGYVQYGRRMIDTFLREWPKSVDLHVYAQDCLVEQTADNLFVHDLHASVPGLVRFKQKWQNDLRATGRLAMGPPDRKGKQRGIGFRWDAVRFSHKVYAVCHRVSNTDSGVVFWMDADMVCHSEMSHDFIEQQIPTDINVAFLGRKNKFTETGLYALNLDLPGTRDFVDRMQWAYDHAEQGVLAMEEFHDCWVFDRSREYMQTHWSNWRELDWNPGNIQGEGHPLINSSWGAYLDHLKGNRKSTGRSHAQDLLIQRQEGYWQV